MRSFARVLSMLLFVTAALDSCLARADIVLLNGSSGLRAYLLRDASQPWYLWPPRISRDASHTSHRFLPGFSRSIQVLFLLSPFSSGPDLHLFKDLALIDRASENVTLSKGLFYFLVYLNYHLKTQRYVLQYVNISKYIHALNK